MATVGRLIAAVGVVTSFLAIWMTAIGGGEGSVTYWKVDGTLAGVLLALGCLAALAGAGALLLGHPAFDVTLGAAGSVLFGLYLWLPAGLAFSDWDALGSGTWLGVCAGLIVIGAGLALSRWGEEMLAPEWGAFAVAALGWILAMAGIWFDVQVNEGSYITPVDGGHGLGVLFLILLGLWFLAAAAAAQTRKAAPFVLAGGIGFVTFGLALFVPLAAAFGGLDSLRIGTWLPLGGGILLSVGSALAIRPEAAQRRLT